MDFSKISSKTLFGKVVRFPLKLIHKGATLPIMQDRLRGKKWVVGAFYHGCWLGSFEFQKQRLLESLIKPGSVVFDIGAHTGFMTLLCSELVGAAGHVFAFEPNERHLMHLENHLTLNGSENVTVVNALVGDSDDPLPKSGNSPSYREVTLDTLLQEKGMLAPNYIVMDIGRSKRNSELAVLRGARETLEQLNPVVVLSANEHTYEACREFLEDLAFHVEVFTTRHNDGNGALSYRILAKKRP
ncbi:MAG: FkbM family methyltransferase [Anaerolineae bacterium]|nr:FkbM family methyltransferase [Anaerolineae bacterium]